MPRVEPNISRKALFEQLEYEPHSDYQWEIHNSPARYRIPCCGRRWGKSTWAGHEMTFKMFVPDSINWIVGPNYGLGEKEFKVVWQDFKKLGLIRHCKTAYRVNQGTMSIYFPDLNSLCMVKSAENPMSLIGEIDGLDHVIMSEAAKHNRSTWEMYIQPGLMDKHGSADFPSTPQGYNWYEGLYRLGQNPSDTEYHSWRLPSWYNPVLFPGGFDPSCENIVDGRHYDFHPCTCEDELIDKFNNVSWMFWAQEYAAEFTAFEGLIFPEFQERVHVREFEYNPSWQNWWALDFGYSDPFVCLDIMIDPFDRVYIWREYVVQHKSTYEHGHILKDRENPEGFHVDCIAADPRGADEIATLAYIIGGMAANPQGVAAGVEAMKRSMRIREDGLPGLIVHPRCTETIRSFKTIHANANKAGYELTRGQWDHPFDAARYFFNEYYVAGGNLHLADVYSGYRDSEAAGFFQYHSKTVLNS